MTADIYKQAFRAAIAFKFWAKQSNVELFLSDSSWRIFFKHTLKFSKRLPNLRRGFAARSRDRFKIRPMRNSQSPKIVCLSNAFDQNYHEVRGEEIDRCLSASKRRDLYHCLQQATGKQILILSSPPKAKFRRTAKWLAPVQTTFANHSQFVSGNWDIPKLRVPLSWIFYARHVLKHVRSGDLVLFDNYEFIYVFAALFVKLFRRVQFILEYEDGKHLIDRSWARCLSGSAEFFGKRLITAALLTHPALGRRLPKRVRTILVPGFVSRTNEQRLPSQPGAIINLLYSGSLDRTRGVDLLLETIPLFPDAGWHLHLSGSGELQDQAKKISESRPEKITFHGALSNSAYAELLSQCHIGLNCQRDSDPISGVTFPSKVFNYLSAGLLVISSRASEVPTICGEACRYYDAETPSSLARAITSVLEDKSVFSDLIARQSAVEKYSVDGTVVRLQEWLREAKLT